MGSPKALLDAGGSSFLARVIASLCSGGAGPILVVLGDLEGLVARAAREAGAVPVLNPDPSPGPIASLQVGIRALPAGAEGVLLAPVDHPLFRPATVAALIGAFRQGRPPVVQPTFEGVRGHPVLFARALFPELLEEALPEGARTVLRRYLGSRLLLPVDDPGILADIDTPEDYRRRFP
jgi:molybdenum cofactor cytidylyltransferase